MLIHGWLSEICHLMHARAVEARAIGSACHSGKEEDALTVSWMEMYSPCGLCNRDDQFWQALPTVLQAQEGSDPCCWDTGSRICLASCSKLLL